MSLTQGALLKSNLNPLIAKKLGNPDKQGGCAPIPCGSPPHPLEAGTVSTRAFVQRIHRHIDAAGFVLLATQHFVAGSHTSHYGPLLLNVALAELPSCLVLNISFQWFHCTERHLLNGTLSPFC